MPHYLLTCECGETRIVEPQQAGISITCECGREIHVPALVQMRKLPAADGPVTQVSAMAWSPQQGVLYAVGITIMVIAAVAVVSLLVLLSRVDTTRPTYSFQHSVDSLTPTEAWTAWNNLSIVELGPRRMPPHIAARQYCRFLYGGLAVTGIVAVVGAALTLFSLRQQRH